MALDTDDLLDALTTLLRPAEVDTTRARLVVELALERVASVISPVPDAARPILLKVAMRGYSNPTDVQQETVGPFSRTFRSAGVYLTDLERLDLLGLSTTLRGAFTIRPGVPK